jgi:hypothetical protein
MMGGSGSGRPKTPEQRNFPSENCRQIFIENQISCIGIDLVVMIVFPGKKLKYRLETFGCDNIL